MTPLMRRLMHITTDMALLLTVTGKIFMVLNTLKGFTGGSGIRWVGSREVV